MHMQSISLFFVGALDEWSDLSSHSLTKENMKKVERQVKKGVIVLYIVGVTNNYGHYYHHISAFVIECIICIWAFNKYIG